MQDETSNRSCTFTINIIHTQPPARAGANITKATLVQSENSKTLYSSHKTEPPGIRSRLHLFAGKNRKSLAVALDTAIAAYSCLLKLERFVMTGMVFIVLRALAAVLMLGTVELSLAQVIVPVSPGTNCFVPLFLRL